MPLPIAAILGGASLASGLIGSLRKNKRNKQLQNQTTDALNQTNQFADEYARTRGQERPDALIRSDEAYNRALEGYKGVMDSSDRFSELGDEYLRFARSGGVDAEGRRRIRGNGVFDEFQQTGGYSPDDIRNIRMQGNAALPAMYNSLKEGMLRQSRISGKGVGFGAGLERLSRNAARDIAAANLATELGIGDRVREGRQWGTEGVSNSERALQDLLGRNFLAGMGGASELEGMGNRDKLAAAAGLRGLRTDTPGEVSMYDDLLLRNEALRNPAISNLINTGMRAPNESIWDVISQATGTAATIPWNSSRTRMTSPGQPTYRNPYGSVGAPGTGPRY